MGLLEILMLGVALATDAFSVTISNTFAFDDHRVSRLMRMPLFFGLFQFGMPLAGYFVGGIAAELLRSMQEWSLSILASSVQTCCTAAIRRSKKTLLRKMRKKAQQSATTLSYGKLLFQAVATAIDALLLG